MLGRITALALTAAGPTLAQDAFNPPAGCTGVLTVQHRSCLVTNVWTCEGDAPGEQWVSLFVEQGPFQVRKVDAEFQWLETHYAFPPRIETMEVPAADPENLTELFATGYDTYDFTIHANDGTGPERVIGFDRLTGETVEIDGEPLLRTEFAYDTIGPDGTVSYSGEGRQFVSERHRLFFLGESWDRTNPDQVNDASPVEFVYPGERGFFTSRPKYDCGVDVASLRGE